MRLYSFTLFLFFCLSWANHAGAGVLIENVHLITVEAQATPITKLYIRDGRIEAIGGGLTAQAGDTRIDGRGGYLTPGLIDSHVHLQGVPGETQALPAAVREAALAQIPRSYLYFGFTTVLDLISDDPLIRQWNAQPLAPTAYHCAGVPIPGGYPLAWLPRDAQLTSPGARYYWYDPRQAELMAATPGSESHKVEPLVARIARTGARCIKTFYETGFGPLRDLPVPSRAMMTELIDAAHQYNLPVFLHGNSREAYEFALDVGVDLLVHGPWHGVDSTRERALSQLAQRIVDAGIGIQPTMQVIYGERELFNPDFFEQPRVLAAIPETLREWYQSEDGQWMVTEMAQEFGGPQTPDLQERVHSALEIPLSGVQAFTRAMAEQGGDLVFGTDTPSGPIYTQFPGVNGREEMDRWMEQGISPRQLFLSMTIRNAELLGLADEIGSIAEGRRADLLLMRANPLVSVEAYDMIEWVVVKGVLVKREALTSSTP